ncbi:MAG: hypothetical protein AMS24_05185 [Chlamydiae bacterium SM23_39]|nr:MAG: hypothetical protein AMS24_05185 [Chlamydiae bacterium SM23_39]
MNELPSDIIEFIESIKNEKNSESNLIEVLHMIQNKYGYLSEENLTKVSYLMNIPLAKITGVATFYHYFKLKPIGKYVINICMGTACHIKKSDILAEKLKEELGIDFGETTKDGLFTLMQSRCFGACALAPIIKIGKDVYSSVTVDQIPKILESYFLKEK